MRIRTPYIKYRVSQALMNVIKVLIEQANRTDLPPETTASIWSVVQRLAFECSERTVRIDPEIAVEAQLNFPCDGALLSFVIRSHGFFQLYRPAGHAVVNVEGGSEMRTFLHIEWDGVSRFPHDAYLEEFRKVLVACTRSDEKVETSCTTVRQLLEAEPAQIQSLTIGNAWITRCLQMAKSQL